MGWLQFRFLNFVTFFRSLGTPLQIAPNSLAARVKTDGESRCLFAVAGCAARVTTFETIAGQ